MIVFNTVKARGIRKALALLFLSIGMALLTSCGGTGAAVKPPPISYAPTITTQPASQTMLLGREATFSVTASGTAPLLYQWYKNGSAIGGANSTSFTTPVVTAADNNTTYSVTISNTAGSVTSSTATLLTGPRAPKLGDWRYLQFEQLPPGFISPPGDPYELGSVEGYIQGVFPAALRMGHIPNLNSGTPFDLCSWPGGFFSLPPSFAYITGSYNQSNSAYEIDYSSYLASINSSNTIILSMDIQPLCGDIAISAIQIANDNGFDMRIEPVTATTLQSQVSSDGASSRIVTAVSFDDATNQIILLSYGWQGDTTTAYEAKTLIAQPADVLTDAASLASQGYFISAFGGNNHDGYILVAMRVQGDNTPRPYWLTTYNVGTQGGDQPTYPIPFTQGFVFWYFHSGIFGFTQQ